MESTWRYAVASCFPCSCWQELQSYLQEASWSLHEVREKLAEFVCYLPVLPLLRQLWQLQQLLLERQIRVGTA